MLKANLSTAINLIKKHISKDDLEEAEVTPENDGPLEESDLTGGRDVSSQGNKE